MANPQPTDAHLRMAHSINEAIMTRDFTKRQRKILDLILRLSWGCGQKDACIPHQRDFSVVGVNEGDIKSELDWLAVSKVIGRDGSFYWFNKDYDDWAVSRVKPYQPEKLGELLSFNLNGNRPQLGETPNKTLVKHQTKPWRNTKLTTPELASPKERLKKVLKKDIYIAYPEFPNVNKMSREEHQKLIETFGDAGTKDRIENLSLYIASKGDKYKNHYATILAWEKRDRKGGQGGAHRQGSTKLTPRDGYTKPTPNPRLERLAEQERAANQVPGRNEPE